MCGITGLILDEPTPQAAGWLTDMTQRLHHRGPNDGGAVVFGPNGSPATTRPLGPPGQPVAWGGITFGVGLGARRLAIIDVSPAGHQPMSAPDGHAWIVFNGEIYNHVALRSELRQRGMAFRGESDTEVFLAAYRAWGWACLARLEGMWGAAIVDWAAGRLLLTRDRFGIKPLYIARFGGGVAFASEIKSLLLLPGARRGVNEARLRDFLSEGRVDHTDETLYEGIWSVPAGCGLEIDVRPRASLRQVGACRRYWRPQFAWKAESDAPGRVAACLRAAVRTHLRSDVPVGSCLSGGLDSSAIVGLLRETAGPGGGGPDAWSQHTFTASLPDSALDETGHAQAVLDAFPDLKGHFVCPTGERLLDDLDRLIWHQEQPFGTPSIYLQWEVMRLARETGVTVLLDGQGGDELFCGYEGYWPAYLAHLVRRGRWVAAHREFRSVSRRWFGASPLAARCGAHLLPVAVRSAAGRRLRARRQRWLARDLFDVEDLGTWGADLQVAAPAPVAGSWRDPVFSRHLYHILLRESLPGLLRFEDRNAMAFSIEARVPFLDRSLVELAMALPPEEKLQDGRMKAVLRQAVRDVVPQLVVRRKDKIGFTAPTSAWMRGPLRNWWRDLIASRSFRERGCFDSRGTEALATRC